MMTLEQIEEIRKLAESHDFKGVPIAQLCMMAARYAYLRQREKDGGFWVARGKLDDGVSLWNGYPLDGAIDEAIRGKR